MSAVKAEAAPGVAERILAQLLLVLVLPATVPVGVYRPEVEDEVGEVVLAEPVLLEELDEPDALAVPACENVFIMPTAVYKGVVEVLPPNVATILESKLNFTAVLLNPEFDDGKTGLV